MTTPRSNSPATDPASPRPADSLPWKLTLMLDEQSVDWQRGARTPVETYLARGAELGDDPEAILNLIYHEVLLRRRLGSDEPTLEEYVARFPHLADSLGIQFALDLALPFEETEDDGPRHELLPSSVQVPGYDVLEVLGRGGMGVVYRARQQALNRTVALKMILDGAHAGARQANRFRSEAAVFARLQHPNIVQIHEIGEHDGRPFLALEYVQGGTLDRALAGTPLPVDRAARLVETLARAVQHAHERGVVHRDLKPANVLLTAEGEPKITDFGLAKLLAGDSRQTESGTLVGTPSYMAPEQVDGPPAVIGPATDTYALGAIFYELLTGRPPFRAESPMATMLQVRGCDVVPPRQLRPGLPRDLETICLKSLEKEPRHRYPTAAALAEDLGRYLDGRPIVARPVPAWERVWLWALRQKTLASGIMLGVVAIAALMAGGIYHNIQLSRLNTRLTSSNLALERARSSAEQNAREALAAITQMLVRAADQRLSGVPEAEPVRRDLLNDALEQLEPLGRRNPTDPEIRHEMGRAHLGIASIHKALGEYAQAADQCREALTILDALLEEHSDNDRLKDTVAGAHLALADLLSAEQGKDHFLRAVALWEPLAEKDPAIRGKLAGSYFAVAFAKNGFGLAPPVSYCQKAIELLESLAKDDPLTYNHDLARAIYNLGLAEATVGQFDSALGHYRRSLKIWDAIPPEQRSESDQEGIVACQNALGTLLPVVASAANRGEAQTILRQAVDSCRELSRRHPRLLAHRAALSRAWSNLGSFYWGENRFEEAESTYANALRANEENVHDFPEDRGLRIRLAHCHQNLADSRAKLKKTQEARQGFERALAVIDPLLAETPHEFAVLQCVGIICLNYGNMVRALSGPAAALPLQVRCVRAFEEANRLAPQDAEMRRVLKGARANLCISLTELNRHEEALAQVEAILPLCDPKERVGYQLLRGLALARLGRHEQAVAEAQTLEREPGLDAASLYNLACVFSLAAAAARADSQLAPARRAELALTHTRAAIALIERSHRDGHFPKKDLLDLLGKDPDMNPIRTTEEFKALIDRLRAS
jgi:tetratricopeptide (TPR) repeat protein